MHRFVLCQTHAKCPDVQGWYLVLEPNDTDTLKELHKGVAFLYYDKFGSDFFDKNPDLAWVCNPVRLTAKWLESVEKYLMAGTTLAINSNGGMVPLNEVTIVAKEQAEIIDWPDHYDDEVITISHWPGGKHYYLSSNKDRIFMPPNHSTYESAERMAMKYTKSIVTNE